MRITLNALADLYEESRAGRTGLGSLDFQPELETVLMRAGCLDGDRRELAQRELEQAAAAGIIHLESAHKRVRSDIYKVRLPMANESALYAYLGRRSPTEVRRQWSALFDEATNWQVAGVYTSAWKEFCTARARFALHWENMAPFRRNELEEGRETLTILSRLLSWEDKDVFVRAASCRVCGDSKRLENGRGTLEKLLSAATAGRIRNFHDLGILATPRYVLVAGPLILRSLDQSLDLSTSRDGLSIPEDFISGATIECRARRCVTVENKTSFHQCSLQNPTDLYIHTSYPGSAALALLRKLPKEMEFVHWGDADPAGFDILRELREGTGLPFRSEGMTYHLSEKSPLLSAQEVKLLNKLLQTPALAEERETLAKMLATGRKGAFEQEHRPHFLCR